MRRFSHQRQAVYEALCNTKSHPTAEWVYGEVKRVIPKISLGTVYRNLSELKQSGEIIGFSDNSGVERYDANTMPHIHFKCNCCGKIIDVENINISETEKQIEKLSGGISEGYFHISYGKCKDCVSKIN